MLPLLLLACASAPDEAPAEPLTAPALEQATRAMTDLGARVVTTPAEVEARLAVEALFVDAGLVDVRAEPFVWDAWAPGAATVRVHGALLHAEPLSPSPAVHGLVLPVATGGDLTGAAALVYASDGSRAEQYAQALLGGAAAMIRVTDHVEDDGIALIEVGHTLTGSRLPCVAVDADVGEAIAAAGQVEISIDATVVPEHTSFNVLGRVEGRTGDTVYVTAHYDSWHPSESAFDNGLGVGAMALLARKLVAGPVPERSVVFMATSAEEQGLIGASRWVEAHLDEAVAADFVLNLDVLWAAEGRYFVAATDERWRTLAMEAAADEGIDAIDIGRPGLASDHTPFMTRGVDAMWNTRWPDRHYHTARDTLDQMDMGEALGAVRLHWRVLAEAAGVPGD